MLKTKRLLLVPLDLKYSDEIYNNIWSCKDVLKYTYADVITSKFECNERIKVWINEYTDKKNNNNFVVLKDNKVIGLAGYPILDKSKKEFGLYYQLTKELWGNGYGSEIVETLLDEIKRVYVNAIINVDVVSINYSSIRILKKLGFTITERIANGFVKNDNVYDLLKLNKKL